MWNDKFPISNCERTDIDSAKTIYRSYKNDCGIELDAESWLAQKRKFQIYFPSSLLSDIVFTPKKQPKQTTSEYYFMVFDVKFPRKSKK